MLTAFYICAIFIAIIPLFGEITGNSPFQTLISTILVKGSALFVVVMSIIQLINLY